MKKVRRYDVGRIDGASMTSNGYLKARALATRSGIFNYLKADGSVRRELRHPDDVFNDESMKSLAGVAVTDLHPPEPVHSQNTSSYGKGWTGEDVKRNGDTIEVPITVTDAALIEKIMRGAQEEVSCGYFCVMDETPGEWEGEKYDARQVAIEYNHLASVPLGRAGPECKIRMDAADAEMVEQKKIIGGLSKDVLDPVTEITGSGKKEKKMAKLIIDGVEYEIQDSVAPLVKAKLDCLAKANEQVGNQEKMIQALQGKVDANEAEIKKVKADAEEIKKTSVLSDKEIVKRADALIKVVDFGKKTLGSTVKVDEMEIAAVKKAVVAKLMPDVKVDEKAVEYIDAAFDVLAGKSVSSRNDSLKKELEGRVDANGADDVDAEAAYKKQRQDGLNAWRTAGKTAQ